MEFVFLTLPVLWHARKRRCITRQMKKRSKESNGRTERERERGRGVGGEETKQCMHIFLMLMLVFY